LFTGYEPIRANPYRNIGLLRDQNRLIAKSLGSTIRFGLYVLNPASLAPVTPRQYVDVPPHLAQQLR
jgi:hypothetical protein